MPAKREYTAAELRAKLTHEREQSRLRQARFRARHRDGRRDVFGAGGVTVTPAPENGAPPVPPTPPLTSFPLRRKERAARRTLRAFADRGYVDDPRFWSLVAENYPGLDVELEAMKISDWLNQPAHAKRLCSRSFLDQWFKRAASGAFRTTPAPALPNVVGNGTYHGPPDAFLPAGMPDRNPALLESDLEPIDRTDYRRHLTEARRIAWPERLELLKNGRHP